MQANVIYLSNASNRPLAIHIIFLLSILLLTKLYSTKLVGLILLLIHYNVVQHKYCNVAARSIKCYKTTPRANRRCHQQFWKGCVTFIAFLHRFLYRNASSGSITAFALKYLFDNGMCAHFPSIRGAYHFVSVLHWLFCFMKGDSVIGVRSKEVFEFQI